MTDIKPREEISETLPDSGRPGAGAVSYTHLTLPTILLV